MFSTAHVILALLAINAAAFMTFWWDKRLARAKAWRIRESTLLWLALVGGGAGAVFAQQLLRHKTRKEPFRTTLYLIMVLQAAAIVAWLLAPDLVARFIEPLAN